MTPEELVKAAVDAALAKGRSELLKSGIELLDATMDLTRRLLESLWVSDVVVNAKTIVLDDQRS